LIRDNENNPLSMLSVMRDISMRKKVEQQTKEREENYYSLFNQMSDAFAYHKMIYDEKNNPLDVVFLNVNSNFEKFTGDQKCLMFFQTSFHKHLI
ncbi:MAG: hypothetical protein ACTSQ4_11325, partial [Candidatus Heimdallarchaeaceae archaeon]